MFVVEYLFELRDPVGGRPLKLPAWNRVEWYQVYFTRDAVCYFHESLGVGIRVVNAVDESIFERDACGCGAGVDI